MDSLPPSDGIPFVPPDLRISSFLMLCFIGHGSGDAGIQRSAESFDGAVEKSTSRNPVAAANNKYWLGDVIGFKSCQEKYVKTEGFRYKMQTWVSLCVRLCPISTANRRVPSTKLGRVSDL